MNFFILFIGDKNKNIRTYNSIKFALTNCDNYSVQLADIDGSNGALYLYTGGTNNVEILLNAIRNRNEYANFDYYYIIENNISVNTNWNDLFDYLNKYDYDALVHDVTDTACNFSFCRFSNKVITSMLSNLTEYTNNSIFNYITTGGYTIMGLSAGNIKNVECSISLISDKKLYLTEPYLYNATNINGNDYIDIIQSEYKILNNVNFPYYSVVMPILSYIDNINIKLALQSIHKASQNTVTELIVVCENNVTNIYDMFSYIKKLIVDYPNIILYFIVKEHTGLAESLNVGIDCSLANKVFVHYFNTVSSIKRFNVQSDQLNTYDVVFGNSVYSCENDIFSNTDIEYGYAFAVNKHTLKMRYKFEEYYKDYFRKFIYNCIQNNVKMLFDHTTYETMINDFTPFDVTKTDTIKFDRLTNFRNYGMITVILTFRNEGDEVERTVQSIRSTARNVKIMLVNDMSIDECDYERVAQLYKCIYIKHDLVYGCGPSRDDAVKHIDTKYFILNDAHMRYHKLDWDLELLSYLETHPKSIISANTSIMNKCENGYLTNEDDSIPHYGYTLGCELNYDLDKFGDCGWTSKSLSENWKNEDLVPIVAVMGAGYASSKEWWEYIDGLNGLTTYGLDEGFMSLKTLMMGGNVYIIKDFYIGHIYRPRQPYITNINDVEVARLNMMEVLLDTEEKDKRRMATLGKYSRELHIEIIEEQIKYDWMQRKRKELLPKFVKTYDDIEKLSKSLKIYE